MTTISSTSSAESPAMTTPARPSMTVEAGPLRERTGVAALQHATGLGSVSDGLRERVVRSERLLPEPTRLEQRGDGILVDRSRGECSSHRILPLKPQTQGALIGVA